LFSRVIVDAKGATSLLRHSRQRDRFLFYTSIAAAVVSSGTSSDHGQPVSVLLDHAGADGWDLADNRIEYAGYVRNSHTEEHEEANHTDYLCKPVAGSDGACRLW
jgi:hypothetical protein